MFKSPDSRLSASNSGILATETFLVPITLSSKAKTSQAALDAAHQAFAEIERFASHLTKTAPGILLIPFHENVSPKLSRVEVTNIGKEYRLDLTFALKCPVPKNSDFWSRIRLLSSVFDELGALALQFQDRKGIELHLDEAKLDQEKEPTEKTRSVP